MRPDRSGEQIYFSKNKNVPSPGFEPRPAGGNASILINARENRATPGHVRDDTVPHSDPLRRHKSAHRGRQGITFCITPVPSDHLSDLPPSDDNDYKGTGALRFALLRRPQTPSDDNDLPTRGARVLRFAGQHSPNIVKQANVLSYLS